ncbi:hypothetical protein CR513_05950, partial [Mucuna pruriens]
MLPFALHGYHTSVRIPTRETPYSLLYEMEVVHPIEVEIPSLRILVKTTLEEVEWVHTRYDQLNLIEEKRLIALCHGQIYQKRLKKVFDKKVRPQEYQERVLLIEPFGGGALILTDMDCEELPLLVNSNVVKKYYA